MEVARRRCADLGEDGSGRGTPRMVIAATEADRVLPVHLIRTRSQRMSEEVSLATEISNR